MSAWITTALLASYQAPKRSFKVENLERQTSSKKLRTLRLANLIGHHGMRQDDDSRYTKLKHSKQTIPLFTHSIPAQISSATGNPPTFGSQSPWAPLQKIQFSNRSVYHNLYSFLAPYYPDSSTFQSAMIPYIARMLPSIFRFIQDSRKLRVIGISWKIQWGELLCNMCLMASKLIVCTFVIHSSIESLESSVYQNDRFIFILYKPRALTVHKKAHVVIQLQRIKKELSHLRLSTELCI